MQENNGVGGERSGGKFFNIERAAFLRNLKVFFCSGEFKGKVLWAS